MSAPPSFTEQEVGSPAVPCRQTTPQKPKTWDVKCVLKIMCPKDGKIVAQLARTKVNTADEIYWDDPYFDGTRWTTKRFPGGGSADPIAKEITILNGTSCEDAADTFYHEIWHQNQPPNMGWPEPAEDDAYYNTELWLIARGLPGRPELRTKDANGNVVPDRAKIRAFVQKEYPSPPPPVAGKKQPVPIGSDPANNLTKVRDPDTGQESWRPSRKGDTYSGPEQRKNPKTIGGADWKCP